MLILLTHISEQLKAKKTTQEEKIWEVDRRQPWKMNAWREETEMSKCVLVNNGVYKKERKSRMEKTEDNKKLLNN